MLIAPMIVQKKDAFCIKSCNSQSKTTIPFNITSVDTVYFSSKKDDIKSPVLSPSDFQHAVEKKAGNITNENRYEIISELTEVLDLYLQGEWTDKTQPYKREIILKNLNDILGKRGQGNIVMAQINPAPGDLEGNAKKIMAYIDAAEKIGADTIVFPEMCLMGYPVRDVITRHPFIVKENIKWLKEIAKKTKHTRALVGFAEPRNAFSQGEKVIGKSFHNSVAVLGNGKIEGLVRKCLLPTYNEFNDYRQFEFSKVSGTIMPDKLGLANAYQTVSGKPSCINNHSYGISICEDAWNDSDFWERPLYEKDPVADLAANNPDVLINCSASPTRARKEQLKHNMLSYVAAKYNIPYVYVNQVGAIDESCFEGSSRIYDKNGRLIARAKSFKEQFMIANPIKGKGKVYSLPEGLEKTLTAQKAFSLDYEPDLERTYETLVLGIKDYFKKNGFSRAVIGLSGGLDSSVTAVLLADALGSQNVAGFSLPSEITTSDNKNDAQILANNLGINFFEIPISSINTSTLKELENAFPQIAEVWGERTKNSTTNDNIQARARAMYLWCISNEFKGVLPVATSDKSELYIGYATINGDMTGAIAPIADLPKTKVFALARWLNKNRAVKNAIPQAVINKPPSAELKINADTGKIVTAEEDNMPYEFLDEIIWRIENLNQNYSIMLDQTFEYEKLYKISKKQKEEWLDKFYKKMPSAVFKWWVSPPAIIVDGRSITKTDYRHPITSRINWKEKSGEEISNILSETINA